MPVSDVLDLHGHPGLLMDHVGGGSLADRLLEAPVTLHEGLGWAVDVVKGSDTPTSSGSPTAT